MVIALIEIFFLKSFKMKPIVKLERLVLYASVFYISAIDVSLIILFIINKSRDSSEEQNFDMKNELRSYCCTIKSMIIFCKVRTINHNLDWLILDHLSRPVKNN